MAINNEYMYIFHYIVYIYMYISDDKNCPAVMSNEKFSLNDTRVAVTCKIATRRDSDRESHDYDDR